MRVASLAAVGLVAGVFSSLFGVGGGIITVPLLILLLHVPTKEATVVSLGAIGLTATAGAIRYGIEGEVHVALAALVGLPAAAGALVGTRVQQRVSGRRLTAAFGVLVALIGIWLLVA